MQRYEVDQDHFRKNLHSSTNFMKKTLLKKWSFPLRISSVNVTKSAVSCGFDHTYEDILNGKLHFLCSENSSIVKWGYKDHFKPVYFFYEKISRTQKALKRKANNFHPLRSLCAQKNVALVV